MRISTLSRGLVILLAALQAWTTTAYALDFGFGMGEKLPGPSLTSEYIYRNDTEEALIPVYLLGAVFKPGLYHIPSNMDVIGLLTLAGGTLPEAEIDHVLVRSQSASSQRKVNFDLNQVVQGGDSQRVSLVSNDLVYVKPGKPVIPFDTKLLTVVAIVGGIMTIVATSLLISQTGK